jgi:peptidoglycan/LPS O-acetylase OafA/YrhL
MADISWGGHSFTAERSISEAQAAPASQLRSDIQGLRAIAVLAVLLSHIWPKLIPGGFVGVDVFFVISGYLITRSLFSELQHTGRIALWPFYVRRMKRLLPAATVVLLVVAVLSLWLLPPSLWEDTATEILASAFYLENWRLAWLAVDYLSAEKTGSPVQHFWSLSIEEQFYLFWPLMMIAAGLAARRPLDLRIAVAMPLLLVVAMSFGASVVLTETQPDTAYFLTHTRIWQLGLGGLLAIAVLPEFSSKVREAMRTAGLAAILLAAFAYSTETVFPGYAALLPTLGCALVIAAGTHGDASGISRLLAASPAQYLGGISYSVYLWHWPMVVFAGQYAPDGADLPLGLTIIAATIAIAHLSTRFVEDPIRYSRIDMRKALGFAGGCCLCCVVAGAALYNHFAPQIIHSIADSPDYPGARAVFAGANVPPVHAPVPPLFLLKKDNPELYRKDCHLGFEGTALNPCRYGSDTGAKVVLMGDSHAAHWAPALIAKADEMGWRLETHTKSSCPIIRETTQRAGAPYLHCREWGETLLQYLKTSPPDLIIVAQSRFHRLAGANGRDTRKHVAAAVADVWRELHALGIKIVAIRDTPKLALQPGECITRDPACHAEQSKVLGDDDPLLMAGALVPEVPVIDMTDAVCQDGRCPMVIGNVVVWRDRGHLTATYSRTLATVLAARIAGAASDRLAKLSP